MNEKGIRISFVEKETFRFTDKIVNAQLLQVEKIAWKKNSERRFRTIFEQFRAWKHRNGG